MDVTVYRDRRRTERTCKGAEGQEHVASHTIWFFWSFGFNLVLLRVSDEIVGFLCYFWFLLVYAIFDLTWLHLVLSCLVYFWFVPDWTTHFVLSCSRLGIVRRSFSFLYRE